MAAQPWKSKRFGNTKDRLRPAIVDVLDEVGLPSKGDKRLLSYSAQEDYFSKIRERCIKLASTPHTQNGISGLEAALSKLQIQQQAIGFKDAGRDTVLMAMRKLREGLVASARADQFALDVYTLIIRKAIEWRSFESYQPALLHLLHRLHPKKPLPEKELAEFVSYRVLDLACRLSEHAQAYVVRFEWQLKDELVDKVLTALARRDCRAFWSCKREAPSLQAQLMASAESQMTNSAVQCLNKSYFTVDGDFVIACTGKSPEELISTAKADWKIDGQKVTLQQVKGR